MKHKIQPELRSWIEVERNSDFPIQNIPFGIIQRENGSVHVATRIGNIAVDIYTLAVHGFLDSALIHPEIFNSNSLNGFISLGRPYWQNLRRLLINIFNHSNKEDFAQNRLLRQALVPLDEVQCLLPVKIGDYTDFYSSREHAANVGAMFRDPSNPLLPNWLHMPIAYHGRSSSITVSGTPIHRPKGQTRPDPDSAPFFGPSSQLDFELEMAFIAGKKSELGNAVPTDRAQEHIFGMVLFNDLSARDIQKWEYVPLGPFLGKNFGSAISPWVITLDALAPFRVPGPKQETELLPYLKFQGDNHYDIQLDVYIKPEHQQPFLVSKSNYKYLYWNMAQQLAHHTINGCNINPGDMMASGTISGPAPESYGSLLELGWNGTKPLQMPDGSERKFLNDNDTIIIKGYCEKEGLRIGFGEVSTMILPVVQQ